MASASRLPNRFDSMVPPILSHRTVRNLELSIPEKTRFYPRLGAIKTNCYICSEVVNVPSYVNEHGAGREVLRVEFPSGRAALEVFFPKSEDHTRAHGEDRFLHRKDVGFHRRHVELVFL